MTPNKSQWAASECNFNEVLLGDNSILVIADGLKFSYIVHSTIKLYAYQEM
jgi:hypothetical protein